MSDYCTLADIKAYVSTALPGDDGIFADLITRASKTIDTYCRRTFTQRLETRYFDATGDVSGSTLFLDDDLLGVITLTNGDDDAITSGSYVLLPANYSPKYAIKLKSSSGVSWTYDDDPEQAIQVNGTWGYKAGTVPPDDIKHAAVRLTAWYYHQREAPFETTGFPDLGQVVVPSSIPVDIKGLLDPYVRVPIK
jgi:hypothetical protein